MRFGKDKSAALAELIDNLKKTETRAGTSDWNRLGDVQRLMEACQCNEAEATEALHIARHPQAAADLLLQRTLRPNPWSAFPAYWMTNGDPPKLHASGYMLSRLQKLLPGVTLSSVSRLENRFLWQKYCAEREAIRQRAQQTALVSVAPYLHADSVAAGFGLLSATQVHVDPSSAPPHDPPTTCLNEVYLFHGTTPEAAANIQSTGFDCRRAGDASGTVFGCGTYFASDIKKAKHYSRGALIVARVVLGSFVRVDEVDPAAATLRRPPRLPNNQDADSVIGERTKSAREFVVYTLTQAYPEIIVMLA